MLNTELNNNNNQDNDIIDITLKIDENNTVQFNLEFNKIDQNYLNKFCDEIANNYKLDEIVKKRLYNYLEKEIKKIRLYKKEKKVVFNKDSINRLYYKELEKKKINEKKIKEIKKKEEEKLIEDCNFHPKINKNIKINYNKESFVNRLYYDYKNKKNKQEENKRKINKNNETQNENIKNSELNIEQNLLKKKNNTDLIINEENKDNKNNNLLINYKKSLNKRINSSKINNNSNKNNSMNYKLIHNNKFNNLKTYRYMSAKKKINSSDYEFPYKPEINKNSIKLADKKRKENTSEFFERISINKSQNKLQNDLFKNFYLKNKNKNKNILDNSNNNNNYKKYIITNYNHQSKKLNYDSIISQNNNNKILDMKLHKRINNGIDKEEKKINKKIEEEHTKKKEMKEITMRNSLYNIEHFKLKKYKTCYEILTKNKTENNKNLNFDDLEKYGITEVFKTKVVMPACFNINKENKEFNYVNFVLACNDIINQYI